MCVCIYSFSIHVHTHVVPVNLINKNELWITSIKYVHNRSFVKCMENKIIYIVTYI